MYFGITMLSQPPRSESNDAYAEERTERPQIAIRGAGCIEKEYATGPQRSSLEVALATAVFRLLGVDEEKHKLQFEAVRNIIHDTSLIFATSWLDWDGFPAFQRLVSEMNKYSFANRRDVMLIPDMVGALLALQGILHVRGGSYEPIEAQLYKVHYGWHRSRDMLSTFGPTESCAMIELGSETAGDYICFMSCNEWAGFWPASAQVPLFVPGDVNQGQMDHETFAFGPVPEFQAKFLAETHRIICYASARDNQPPFFTTKHTWVDDTEQQIANLQSICEYLENEESGAAVPLRLVTDEIRCLVQFSKESMPKIEVGGGTQGERSMKESCGTAQEDFTGSESVWVSGSTGAGQSQRPKLLWTCQGDSSIQATLKDPYDQMQSAEP